MLGMPLQASYPAVKEQRGRADRTKVNLQERLAAGRETSPPRARETLPPRGREAPPPRGREIPPPRGREAPPPRAREASRAVDDAEEPTESPTAGSFFGVSDFFSPRSTTPPEPEEDMTDGAQAYETVREIAGDERPEVHPRRRKEEVLVTGTVSVGGGLPQSCKILRFWGFPGQKHPLVHCLPPQAW